MTGAMQGQLLSNRYLVGERVGIGGMAEVYQGQDTVLGRVVAIKVMLPQYAEDPSFTQRFRQEAAAAANLQSPYIVNVYDWGRDPKTPYIVMEFIRGSDLKTAINERGSINQRKVAEIGSQVAQALSVAHGLDIIHRDIKPQNIMIQPDGNVKVMDFGIARAKNSMLDKTDAVLGTAHYISPEQAQGKDLSPTSDIYSLGIVLYEAVTGQLPFDGPDAVSVALKQVNEQPRRPSEILPTINPDLEAIIMKAMDKNPENRFETALDMRQALNDYLSGRPVNLGGVVPATAGMGAMAGGTAVAPGAPTAVMGDDPSTQTIPPNPVMYHTDRTNVMTTAEMGGMAAGNTGGIGGTTGSQGRVYSDRNGSQKKGQKKGPIIAVAVLAAVAILALLGFVLLGNSCSGSGPEVPNVTGKTLEQATQAIEDAGFEVGSIDYVYDESAPADTVISQTPRAGTHQESGTKIALTISQGVEQVSVPDLKNMTANEARQALQKLGLKYEAGASEHSSEVAQDRVLRQSPEANKKVDKGSTVTFYLSSGPEKVDVPSVIGALEGNAVAVLNNAGFQVATDYQNSSSVPEGAVISQSPAAGGKAEKGSTVSILVSLGQRQYTASAGVNGSGGTVSPSSVSVPEGGSVTFTISPSAGYTVSNVTDSYGNSYGAAGSVTISNINGDVSLSVTFKQIPSSGGGSSTSSAKPE